MPLSPPTLLPTQHHPPAKAWVLWFLYKIILLLLLLMVCIIIQDKDKLNKRLDVKTHWDRRRDSSVPSAGQVREGRASLLPVALSPSAAASWLRPFSPLGGAGEIQSYSWAGGLPGYQGRVTYLGAEVQSVFARESCIIFILFFAVVVTLFLSLFLSHASLCVYASVHAYERERALFLTFHGKAISNEVFEVLMLLWNRC